MWFLQSSCHFWISFVVFYQRFDLIPWIPAHTSSLWSNFPYREVNSSEPHSSKDLPCSEPAQLQGYSTIFALKSLFQISQIIFVTKSYGAWHQGVKKGEGKRKSQGKAVAELEERTERCRDTSSEMGNSPWWPLLPYNSVILWSEVRMPSPASLEGEAKET